MKGYYTLAILTTLAPFSEAASTPWIGPFNSNQTITVPAGKILIIEGISCSSEQALSANVTITGSYAGGIGSGTFEANTRLGIIGTELKKLETPIRLGPGMAIKNNLLLGYVLYGTAMDVGDFFASADPVIHRQSTQDGRFSAIVDTRTTLPTVVRGQTSTDLNTWTPAAVATTRSSLNPRFFKFVTSAAEPVKFFRAITTTNPLLAPAS